MTNSKTPMQRSEINNVFRKLEADLRSPVWDAAQKLLKTMDEDGKANSAKLHEAIFPLAESTKSASAQLSKLLKEIIDTATRKGFAIDYGFEGEKQKGAANRFLQFFGPSITMSADLEGLRSIPAAQVITGQTARVVDGKPKILIVTFNEHEHAALNQAFGKAAPFTINEGDCLVDDLGNHGGLHVIHLFSQQGTANAQESITRANTAYRPRYVVACGIAFGVDEKKQRMGDVLGSEFIVPYESARVTSGNYTLRGAHPAASAKLFEWLRQLDQRMKASFNKATWPTLHLGGILSGDKLVDDVKFRANLVELAGQQRAIGGEMESAGMHTALRQSEIPWIVIKSICDWGDGNKNNPNKDQDQKTAAANAALVVKTLIDTSWLTPHSDTPAQQDAPDTCPCLFEPTHNLDVLKNQTHFAELQNGRKTKLRDPQKLGAQATLSAKPETTPDDQVIALDYLLHWAKTHDEREFFALLGETGMGKTTTVQRLAQRLSNERAQSQDVPLAVYFDLRKVDANAIHGHNTGASRDAVPLSISERTIIDCIRNGWLAVGGRLPTLQEVQNAIDGGALVIYDGLDEVLSRIGEREGLTFTQGLLRTLEESKARRGADAPAQQNPSKLLISCRTQFFRSLAEQDEHLTGERRGPNQPDRFRALELQPLTDEQIRQYLHSALPAADANALIHHIKTIHNLRELAGRPFTLTLVQQFLPQIEEWKRTGQRITGALLYRQVARDWLVRDKQKQTLRLEDKETLAADLALWFCQTKVRGVSAQKLEDWVDQWIYAQGPQSRYASQARELLYEDVRNSTFLKRVDNADAPEQSRFEFAHTSLYEFFLALGLFMAVQNEQRQHWTLGSVSQETLSFLGQLLQADAQQAKLLSTLSQWRLTALAGASELQLAYAERAYQTDLPLPATAGFDMSGIDLSDQSIGCAQEPTGPAQGALFDLANAKFDSAVLRRTKFWACDLQGATFDNADLAQAEMLNCAVDPHLKQRGADQHLTIRCFDKATPSTPPALSPAMHHIVAAGHVSAATACAFSPDGRTLASAGGDNTLRLWDAASGAQLRVFMGHQNAVTTCAFSPDGRTLASAGWDKTLRLWDAASGAQLRVFEGQQGPIQTCAFSPDGRTLASAGGDNTLRLWDAASGVQLRVFEGHQASIAACAFSPDGRTLASAGNDTTLRLWDAASGAQLRVFEGNPEQLTACAFSPDGRTLASAGRSKTLRLWDTASGAQLRVFEGHLEPLTACAFSPDGSTLASAGWDKTLRLWDAASGAQLRVFEGHEDWIQACVFSPDGRTLASAGDDSTLRLWDAASGAQLRVFEGLRDPLTACAFSPDGHTLASAGWDKTLRLWDAASGAQLRVFEGHQASIAACAFSPDGRTLASTGRDKTLRLWDAASGAQLRVFEGQQEQVTACAFSPDGSTLASAGRSKTLRLWDTASGAQLRVFEGHLESLTACAFSPDGSTLASASWDKTLRLWDAATGAQLRVFEGHQDWVTACAFSPDGRTLTSAGWDQSLRLWDAASGAQRWVSEGHLGLISACAFSPDGRTLATAGSDSTLRLWDAASGTQLRVFEGNQGLISACTFSLDGRTLASAGDDSTLRLWDVARGALVRSHLHADCAAAAWHPTGDLIYCTGRAWRYLNYQVQNADGTRQVTPIEECSAWE